MKVLDAEDYLGNLSGAQGPPGINPALLEAPGLHLVMLGVRYGVWIKPGLASYKAFPRLTLWSLILVVGGLKFIFLLWGYLWRHYGATLSSVLGEQCGSRLGLQEVKQELSPKQTFKEEVHSRL